MRAPSQCVKWMISDAAMPGKRYFVPPEKPTTSCGKTGPQMRTWSVLDDEPVERDRDVLLQASEAELLDHLRGDGPQRRERRGVVPPVVENPPVSGTAVNDRASDEAAELLVAHRRMRAERDEKVERRDAWAELALEDLEHQRHRHRPRPVGDEDDNALAVEGQTRQPLPREVRHFLRREMSFDDASSDHAHMCRSIFSECRRQKYCDDVAAAKVLYSSSIISRRRRVAENQHTVAIGH